MGSTVLEVVFGFAVGGAVIASVLLGIPWLAAHMSRLADAYDRYVSWVEKRSGREI